MTPILSHTFLTHPSITLIPSCTPLHTFYKHFLGQNDGGSGGGSISDVGGSGSSPRPDNHDLWLGHDRVRLTLTLHTSPNSYPNYNLSLNLTLTRPLTHDLIEISIGAMSSISSRSGANSDLKKHRILISRLSRINAWTPGEQQP